MKSPATRPRVSPNNPCPFLRALVSEGLLDNRVASIGDATAAIERVASAGEGSPTLPSLAIRLIALLANGLDPPSLFESGMHGMKLNALRDGPFDKKGAGSRILNARAGVNETQLRRLEDFASIKTLPNGTQEIGLNAAQLEQMMDANFKRAEGCRRMFDRKLMDGEWPVLLEVMGKEGLHGRFLSLKELRALFAERRLPPRMMKRLAD